ncbi:MAG: lasso peptide biosynthesis B2 protein [Sphingomonas sp.]
MSAGPIVRFRRLSGERRRLLIRAAAVLTGASAAVALLPFRRAIRFGSVPVAARNGVSAADCVWAVAAAARRLPLRTVCIEQGLAVQRMARAAGLAAILHYGVRHDDETNKLEAHVWVTVEGQPIIGGDDAAHFALVASYP